MDLTDGSLFPRPGIGRFSFAPLLLLLVAVVPVGVVVTVVVEMVYHPAVAAGNVTCPSPMTQP